LIVRRLVHSLGYRYRLHRRDLAGRPILYFRRARKSFSCMGVFGTGTLVRAVPESPKRTPLIGQQKFSGTCGVTQNNRPL
jgi:DNA mismatch endonuclease (patch repair protein)